jgi:hypothetical protein
MSFFGSLLSHKKTDPSGDENFQPLLDMTAAVLGPEITSARGYLENLIPALTLATRYFDEQILTIPGPVATAAAAYGRDPFLRSVFPDFGEIQIALGRSVEVKEVLPKLAADGHPRACAMMGLRCKDRDQAPAAATIFADHTLACVTSSAAETRAAIRHAAVRRVIGNYHAHLEKLRQKGKLLPEEWNIEHAPDKQDSNAEKRHLIFDDFIYAERELHPDNLLRGLVAWLERPDEHFRLVESGLVLAFSDPEGGAAVPCQLPLVFAADRRRWMVVLVEFAIDEGLLALGVEARSHRYILI